MSNSATEKFLYFSQKKADTGGFHVRAGLPKSDLLFNVVKNCVEHELVEKVRQSPRGDRFFKTTEKGDLELLAYQMQARTQLGKPIDEHVGKFASLAKKMYGEKAVEDFTGMLRSSQKPGFKRQDIGQSDLSKLARRLNWFSPVHNEDKLARKLSAVGREFLVHFDRLHPGHSTQLTPEESVARTIMAHFSDEPVLSVYDGFPVDTPDDGVDFNLLVTRNFVHEVGRDEGGVHYSVSPLGVDFARNVEKTMRQAGGGSVEDLFSDSLKVIPKVDTSLDSIPDVASLDEHRIDNFAHFHPDMTLSDYSKIGNALAKQHLDEDAYAGFNELHWDECHMDGVPLKNAVMALVDAAPSLRMNSPAALKERHDAIKGVLEDVMSTYRDVLEPGQLVPKLRERVQSELGFNIDAGRADHFVRSYGHPGDMEAKISNVVKVDVDTKPKPRMTVESGSAPDYGQHIPRLRPGG